MKKQNIAAAVGTVALLANLLVPGLAFGQPIQGQQASTQEIKCPEEGGTAEFSMDAPTAVNFDVQTASSEEIWSYDQVVTDGALPVQNVLSVTDTRSGGADGCPTTLAGFTVKASATSLSKGSGTPIPNSRLFLRTSSSYSGSANCVSGICYDLPASNTGNTQDVVTPLDLTTGFRTSTSYVTALDTQQLLLSTATSHNQTMKTGVVLSVHIPANQAPGIYSGTVTYTLAKN